MRPGQSPKRATPPPSRGGPARARLKAMETPAALRCSIHDVTREITMRVRTLLTAFAALLALAGNAAAADAPTDQPGRCFSTVNFNNWKAGPDAKTIYIRVGTRDYYRLDLSTSCYALQSPNPHLITQWRGSNFVC